VRKAIEQVNQTAQLSSNKVVMIENIETMSESASNALLKTLEEPTNNTYLVLTTNAPQYIMATIKSRCEKIRVPMPSYEQSRAYLADEGWVQVYDKATEAGKQLRQAGLNRVLILSSLFACVASVACVTNVEDSPKT